MSNDVIWNEAAWMVRVPGTDSIVGPVSLDQVRRGLAHQKLDRAAEIAREGTNEWRSAGAFVSDMMSHHGPPAAVSAARIAAPSVDMTSYPDRPPPPPYAAGQPPSPPPGAKASIRGLFPKAGRGKPPPPPDFRKLASDVPPSPDQPLPSDQLPLPAPPSRSSHAGAPPLPAAAPPKAGPPPMPGLPPMPGPPPMGSSPMAGPPGVGSSPMAGPPGVGSSPMAGPPGMGGSPMAGPPGMGGSPMARPMGGPPPGASMGGPPPLGGVAASAGGAPPIGPPPLAGSSLGAPVGVAAGRSLDAPHAGPVAGVSAAQAIAPQKAPPQPEATASKGHAIPAPLPPKSGRKSVPSASPFSPAPSAAAGALRPGSKEPETRAREVPVVAPEREPISTTVPSPFDTPVAKGAEAQASAVAPTPTTDATKTTEPSPRGASDTGQPARCLRCGSDALLEAATLGILGGAQVVLHLPDGTRAMVTTTMCGQCGDLRLTAEGARHLFEAMRKKS